MIILNTHTLRVTIIKGKFDLKLNSKGSRGPYSAGCARDCQGVPRCDMECYRVLRSVRMCQRVPGIAKECMGVPMVWGSIW